MAETDDWTAVELLLTPRGYQQLLREATAASAECRPATAAEKADGWAYHYRGRVHGFHGVGRFVLGLPLEVRIVAPEGLRRVVLEKVAGARW